MQLRLLKGLLSMNLVIFLSFQPETNENELRNIRIHAIFAQCALRNYTAEICHSVLYMCAYYFINYLGKSG